MQSAPSVEACCTESIHLQTTYMIIDYNGEAAIAAINIPADTIMRFFLFVNHITSIRVYLKYIII